MLSQAPTAALVEPIRRLKTKCMSKTLQTKWHGLFSPMLPVKYNLNPRKSTRGKHRRTLRWERRQSA